MEQLTNLSTIRQILERHHFSFSKALGQNFLVNPEVCPRMARLCGATDADAVIEIGPGIGVLTAELAKVAKKVIAIELDERLLPILADTLADFDNVTVLHADVMEVDLQALIARELQGMRVFVCANLPYYITTPILMRLLEARLPIEAITVMVQKEAAKRICALPSTRESGAVSAAVRYYCEPKVLFPVSRGSFLPAPNVDSAVIGLRVMPAPTIRVADEETLFAVIRASFSQRRKTILNALSAGLGMEKAAVEAILRGARLDARLRAEQLTMEQFGTLADAVFAAKKGA